MSNIRVKTFLDGTSEYIDSNSIVSGSAFVDNLIVYDANPKAVGDVGYFQFELSDGTITRSYFATYVSNVGLDAENNEITATTGNSWYKYSISLSNVMTKNANGVKINSSIMWTFSVVNSDTNNIIYIRNTFSNRLVVGASIPVSISEEIDVTLEQELRSEMSALSSQVQGGDGKVFVGSGADNDATWETFTINGKALNETGVTNNIYVPSAEGTSTQVLKGGSTWFTPLTINGSAFTSASGGIYAPTSSPSSTKAFLRSNGGAIPQWAEMEITSNSTTSEKTYTIKLGQQVIGTIVYPINSGVWGNITGTLSSQTDLQQALNGKQATLVSGANIKTINSTSIVGSGNIDVVAKKPDGTNDLITQNNKIATTYLPDTITGQLVYKGTFNDVDDLPSPSAENKGWYYVFNGASPSGSYVMGDWAVSNGTTYDKIDNTDAVQSVCGKTGSVSLEINDITGLKNALDTKQKIISVGDYLQWEEGTSMQALATSNPLRKVWFDTSVNELHLDQLTYEDGLCALYSNGTGKSIIAVDLLVAEYSSAQGYGLLSMNGGTQTWIYSTLNIEGATMGWQNLDNGYIDYESDITIATLLDNTQIQWNGYWCKAVVFDKLDVADGMVATLTATYTLASGKQDALVSGTNIKTINSTSLLGSGDISITQPTKTSDLTNDSGFITNSYHDATKKDVGTISTTSASATISLAKNTCYRVGTISQNTTLDLVDADKVLLDFESELIFTYTSGTFTYPDGNPTFTGTDCNSSGVFVPVANKTYDIIFYNTSRTSTPSIQAIVRGI